jgi:hypothetical protein
MGAIGSRPLDVRLQSSSPRSTICRGDADILAVLARVRLRRLAPTAIKQDVGGLHARGG